MNSTAKSSKSKLGKIAIIIAICLILIGTAVGIVLATTTTASSPTILAVKTYQADGESNFQRGDEYLLNGNFVFGMPKAGNLALSNIDTSSSYNGYTSYGITEDVKLTYTFDATSYKTWKEETGWKLSDCTGRYALEGDMGAGIDIKYGAVVVQRRYSNEEDYKVIHTGTNILSGDYEQGKTNELYTIPVSELKEGAYYRISIVYEIRKYVSTNWWNVDEYEYKSCVEETEIFVCDNRSYVEIGSMTEGGRCQGDATVPYGFNIYNNNPVNTVKVKVPSGNTYDLTANAKSYYTKGDYTITETTLAGKNHVTRVKVENGLTYKHISGKSYNTANDTGYVIKDGTANGSTTYAEPIIFIPANGTVNKVIKNGQQIFGVVSDRVFVTFRLPSNRLPSITTGKISNDSWGTSIDQKIDGTINTGVIGTGALIIQKSNDGVNWTIDEDEIVNGENQLYKDAVFTTDYQNSYGQNAINTIYTPKGLDILNYKYFRILYAYEVEENGTYKNYIEEFVFSICSENLESALFHNMSLDGYKDENVGEGESVEFDTTFETLLNGSETRTGIRVDKSKNPSLKIDIKKNNGSYTLPANNEITDNGRYDITVTAKTGKTKSLTLYVNKYSANELYSKYFGDSALMGKRIYIADSDIPVFEGKLSYLSFSKVDDFTSPLWGTITNTTTGTKTTITPSREGKTITLEEAGVYQVKLNTNSTFNTQNPAGDNCVFTLSFRIITNGTAPGPVVNKQSLLDFNKVLMPSNLRSVVYTVSHASATVGDIHLAFPTYQEAYKYALNFEKQKVVPEKDGFVYNGMLNVKEKVVYESGWDLADAEAYFASKAVVEKKIDLSKPYTYRTVTKEDMDKYEELRQMLLAADVILVHSSVNTEDIIIVSALPIINSHTYEYVKEGLGTKEEMILPGKQGFEFVRDENGYESNKVTIIDSKGQEFSIEYNKSVEDQLREKGCAGGIITIREATVYNDIAEYQAIYLEENQNTAEIEITFNYENGKETKTLTQEDNGTSFKAYNFTISNSSDDLVGGGLITVKRDGEETFFQLGEPISEKWDVKGAHTVTVTNRYGYSYSFVIEVESQIFSVDFEGEGTDDLGSIKYEDGQETVTLPTVSRYGYNFLGYRTPSGQLCSEEVATILLKGNAVLEAVWQAKQFKLTYEADDGPKEMDITFGETYDLDTVIEKPSSTSTKRFVSWKNESTNETISTLSVEREGDVTLYAEYEYIINFVGMGTQDLEPLAFMLEDDVELPALTRYGYTFGGFKGDDGNTYTGTVKGSDLENCTTLTVIWTAKTVTITLYKDGAVFDTLTADFGTEVTLPVIENGTNSTFKGWCLTDSTETTEKYSVTTLDNVSFYTEIEYKITVLGNGIADPEAITFKYNSTVSLPNLERYGYVFGGYKGNDDNTYTGVVSGNNLKSINTLTAIWTAKTVTITLYKDGAVFDTLTATFGTEVTLPVIENGTNSTFKGWCLTDSTETTEKYSVTTLDNVSFYTEIEYKITVLGNGIADPEAITFKYNSTVSLPSLERYGYVFGGYKGNDDNTYTGVVSGNNLKSINTLTAIWTAKTVTITLYKDGAVFDTLTAEFGKNATLPVIENTANSTFKGWTLADSTEVITELTIDSENPYSLYTELEYSIELTGIGTEGLGPIKFKVSDTVVLPTLTRANHVFDGYKTPNGLKVSGTIAGANLIGITTLEAQWIADMYKVELYVDGKLYMSFNVAVEQSFTLQPYVGTENKTFIGWYKEGEDQEITAVRETESCIVKVYAKFEYSVAFEGEGTNSLTPIKYKDGESVTLPTLTRNGYIFGGYETKDGTIVKGTIDSSLLEGTTTLKAIWIYNQYKVELYVGTTLYQSYEKPVGESFALPTIPNEGNKEFIGWYKDGESTPVTSVVENTVCTIKLYASFKYTITLEGEGSDDLEDIVVNDNGSLELPSAERYGYEFGGYKTESGEIITGTLTKDQLDEIQTLTPVWEAKSVTIKLNNELGKNQTSTVKFGESYTLPTLEDTETMTFVGWKRTDTNQMITIIKVDKENSIELLAVYKEKTQNDTPVVPPLDEEDPITPPTDEDDPITPPTDEDDPITPPVDDNPTQDPSDTDPTPPQNDQKRSLKWWQIVIISICFVIFALLTIGSRIGGAGSWIAVVIGLVALILLCIFAPWPWWVILLVTSLGTFALGWILYF